MKKIYYLSYYNRPEYNNEKRLCMLSAVNKMEYLISALNEIGYDVDIVSASGALESNAYRGSKRKISQHNSLTLFSTIGRSNIIRKILDLLMIRIQLAVTLLRCLKPGTVLICYHSTGYMRLLTFMKKILKFKLILEVEEIYSDVIDSKNGRKTEDRLFAVADAFVFPTEMLNQTVNLNHKPFCIVHGRYVSEERVVPDEIDSVIHVVYSGTLDPRKGCLSAVDAAEFLDNRYHIHIIGTGSKEDIILLEKEIEEVSKKTSCAISYDGVKQGAEYLSYLQGCKIGLSPQDPTAKFNGTSFPSKVLSYLSNGLTVVSINIPAIKNSAVSDLISFYDEQSPEVIADTIRNTVVVDKEVIAEKLSELNIQSLSDMKRIIE